MGRHRSHDKEGRHLETHLKIGEFPASLQRQIDTEFRCVAPATALADAGLRSAGPGVPARHRGDEHAGACWMPPSASWASACCSRCCPEPFGMDLAYGGGRPQDVRWRHVPTVLQLAADSDVLVLYRKGGQETRHLVGARVLQALGAGWPVNMARGSESAGIYGTGH